jgi:hypothetical protein
MESLERSCQNAERRALKEVSRKYFGGVPLTYDDLMQRTEGDSPPRIPFGEGKPLGWYRFMLRAEDSADTFHFRLYRAECQTLLNRLLSVLADPTRTETRVLLAKYALYGAQFPNAGVCLPWSARGDLDIDELERLRPVVAECGLRFPMFCYEDPPSDSESESESE